MRTGFWSVAALGLAGLGFCYLDYLFVLAHLTMSAGIPDMREWELIHETGARPETLVFASSCLWGLLPLALLLPVVVAAAWGGRVDDDARRYRWHRRAAVALLLIGLPLAIVAYGTWYQIGW